MAVNEQAALAGLRTVVDAALAGAAGGAMVQLRYPPELQGAAELVASTPEVAGRLVTGLGLAGFGASADSNGKLGAEYRCVFRVESWRCAAAYDSAGS